ncbi:MAG: DUF6538 domain-containing protein [Desulfovibrionaceae bacterium]
MPRCPGVQRRKGSANYRLRVKVPTDLLAHYHPKKELTRSLGTSDYRAACDKARVERVKLDQEFAEVRDRLAAQAQPRTSLTDTEVERLCALAYHSMVQADEEIRVSGMARDDFWFRQLAANPAEVDRLYRPALARGDVSVVAPILEDWLQGHGIELDPASERYQQLAYAFLKAVIRASEVQAKRNRGEVVDTPSTPPPLPSPAVVRTSAGGELPLSGLFEKWKDENGQRVAGRTLDSFEATVRRFLDLHGDLPLPMITKAHVREFKDTLLKCPAASHLPAKHRKKSLPELVALAEKDRSLTRLTARTVNDKWLGFLCAILSWGTKNGYLENNPASNVKAAVSKVKDRARLPYSIDDLNMIFRFPVFTVGDRPRAGGGEAAKWLPLLALFTGARLKELGTLLVDDVRQDRDVWYLDLMNTATKTQESKRRVPIHPELVRLGFLDYVEARRKAGDGPLFPDRNPTQPLDTESWSKWWGRYARTNGIEDRRKVFHSFRHTAKDGLRDSGVAFDLRSVLQGHTVPGVGEGYGLGVALLVLAEAMAKLQYPGLDLEHLVPGSRPMGVV